MTFAKICGVTTPEAIQAAIQGGAEFIGLVAYPKSPRFLTPTAMNSLLDATGLNGANHQDVAVVVVTADADDLSLKHLRNAVCPDFIQLHGSETVERAERIRAMTGAGIIKAIPVSRAEDLEPVPAWAEVADHLLFDARTPPGSYIPGGMGASFDWGLLAGLNLDRPWFLAGGLTPDNVGDAIRRTGAPMVDVSSGVESAPGVKDTRLIRAFLDRVRDASPRQ